MSPVTGSLSVIVIREYAFSAFPGIRHGGPFRPNDDMKIIEYSSYAVTLIIIGAAIWHWIRSRTRRIPIKDIMR